MTSNGNLFFVLENLYVHLFCFCCFFSLKHYEWQRNPQVGSENYSFLRKEMRSTDRAPLDGGAAGSWELIKVGVVCVSAHQPRANPIADNSLSAKAHSYQNVFNNTASNSFSVSVKEKENWRKNY